MKYEYYTSSRSLRGGIVHAAGHKRLGDAYTVCGAPLGRKVKASAWGEPWGHRECRICYPANPKEIK